MSRVEAAAAREQAAAQPPVLRAAAFHIARAHRDVGAGLDRGEHRGQVAGIVAAVGVHLHHGVIVARQPPAKPLHVGGAQPQLAGAVQHVDARIRGGHLIEHGAGAIG
jgi:hypothetical protein